MKVLHAANLCSWQKSGQSFGEIGGFGKKLWFQHFLDPHTMKEERFVLFSQKDWVVTCPILENGDLVLVQDWNQGCEALCTGFPGGTLETGEGFVCAAEREVAEETGIVADNIVYLGSSFIATRNSPTRYGMFVGTNCRLGGAQNLDAGEYLQVIRVTQKEFWEMVDKGEISCGCSVELAARAVRHRYLEAEPFLKALKHQ